MIHTYITSQTMTCDVTVMGQSARGTADTGGWLVFNGIFS